MVSIYVIGDGPDKFMGTVPYDVAWDALSQGSLKNVEAVSLHDGERLSGEFSRQEAVDILKKMM